MVNHKEECTKFLLWDHECTKLIGQSADEVNRLKIADGDVDLNVSPEVLDKLLGYSLVFKVKVQPKFKNFVVLKYSSDLDLIKTIVDLLPDAEVLFCDPYFSTHWDTHILYLCLLSVPIYMIQASYKTDIPLPDYNDPPNYETMSAKFDVPIFTSYL
ncbi:uncharacterized protein LOC114420316 isoform X1 [Glycine soja]|uniref:uncharacterized protein LOC114420316 isoform X1 n=1 Tax=Glycine soja TaxID=3848 RepID=UPI00103A7560|nr:uncharacterized protein LOC114420316 isoform X1 [Glycine soja]